MRLTPPRTLADLADYAGQEIRKRLAELGGLDLPYVLETEGDGETLILALEPVESIKPGCLTFATSNAYLDRIEKSGAAAVILPPPLACAGKPFIRARDPRLVFSVILELIMEEKSLVPAGSGRVSFKDQSRVEIGEDTIIGDWCYIGSDVKIGPGCRIYPQVFIDDHVTLGEGCVIYPGVTLFRHTVLGRRVIIHSGSVIGDDGFGFNQVPDPERNRIYHMKNEHIGGVVIGDWVELGSQVCVDRGLAGNTVIGSGTKMDNQIQIGHNVQIGRDCIIVAQSAMAGSGRLGDQVFLSGHVGVTDGVSVGNGAVITAKSLVLSDVPPGRIRWGGQPVRKIEQVWKQAALAKRELPRLREFFRLFKKAGSFDELKAEFFKKAGPMKDSKDE